MFDEQPDGDPHGECAAEIHKLERDLAAARTGAASYMYDLERAQGIGGRLEVERDAAQRRHLERDALDEQQAGASARLVAQMKVQDDFITHLANTCKAAEAEIVATREALCMIYDKWEAGTSCCDEEGTDLGNALKLDKAEENSILALIPLSRDAMATSIAAQIEAGSPGPEWAKGKNVSVTTISADVAGGCAAVSVAAREEKS